MISGTVKWFDDEKGYGFIVHEDIEEDIFVHYSDINGDGFRVLTRDEPVEFRLTGREQGLMAHDVRRLEETTHPRDTEIRQYRRSR